MKSWKERLAQIAKMMTILQLLAIIFPCVTGLTIDDQFIRDVVNSQGLERCDFGFVSDYKESKIAHHIFADVMDKRLEAVQIMSSFQEIATYIFCSKHTSRPIMMRSYSTLTEDISEVLPNHSACVIHFLPTFNLNLTLHYLKSAWRSGSISANHIYLVANIKPTYDRAILDLNEVFDFQRLFVISSLSPKVN